MFYKVAFYSRDGGMMWEKLSHFGSIRSQHGYMG